MAKLCRISSKIHEIIIFDEQIFNFQDLFNFFSYFDFFSEVKLYIYVDLWMNTFSLTKSLKNIILKPINFKYFCLIKQNNLDFQINPLFQMNVEMEIF